MRWVSKVRSKGRIYHYLRLPEALNVPACRLAADPERAQQEAYGIALDAVNAMPIAIYMKELVVGARQRARLKQIECSINTDGMVAMLLSNDMQCAVSKLPFDLTVPEASNPFDRPFAPSIDRVDSKIGYTRENVRLVCRIVNFGMGQWGYETYRRVAIAVVSANPITKEEAESFANRSEISGFNRILKAKVLQGQTKLIKEINVR